MYRLIFFCFFCMAFCSTNIKSQSTSSITGIINHYAKVINFACDSTTLVVSDASGFNSGDEILILQMQGAEIDQSNNANFGDIINFQYVGNYEINRIKYISGNNILLQFKLSNSYSVNGSLQIVSIPEYYDVSASGLTCQTWDGATGGVLVFDVSGTLTMEDDIIVSGKGFRGGQVIDTDNAGSHETNYFYSVNPDLSAAKGESIAITSASKSFGRGKSANGGGGGNAHNAGGGGGANGGAGGNGGLEYYNTPFSPTPNTNGLGGSQTPNWVSNPGKLILGGGGGAGHTNDQVGTSGGNGGGIVFIIANNIKSNNHSIIANGNDVLSPGNQRNDGQGGGGGGGTIVIDYESIDGSLYCQAKGGNGGDCIFYVNSQIIGPGGGGGGGKIQISQIAPTLNFDINGGTHGIANQGLSNGAQYGQNGKLITNFTPIKSEIPNVQKEYYFYLCEGQTFQINNQAYSAPDTIIDVQISTNGCDSIIRYYLLPIPSPTTLTTLSLCPGESINIGGILYNQPGTVTDTIPSLNGGCDTIATYIILRADQPVIYDTLSLCPGDTLMFNGHLYWQTGTFLDTIYAPEPGICDTLIYYTLEPSPIDLYVQVQEAHCENGGVAISGNICNQGTNALPEVMSLGLYSSNPFTSQPETQSIHLISTNGVDSCYKFLINNLNPTFLNYSSIYVIVNDDGAIIPPFSSMNFPQGNIIECNYLNNLDSIDINAPNQQIPNLGPDLVFCQDTSIVLNTNDTFFQYLWQDGSTNATFHVEQTGNYWVQATDICGLIHSDTVQVAFDLSPDTSFADQSICPGVSVHLGVPNGYSTFLWAPSAGIDCPVCQNVNIQPATTTAYTLNAFTSLGCILSDTFTINVLTLPTRTETISFCPGESILIDGQTYNQSATVIDTIPSVGTDCDTIVTYLLTLLPQPTYTQIIEFCKGDQVSLNNQIFSEPGIVTFAIPSSTGGCDTLATYILQYLLPDSPVQISIACPDNISIEAAPGQSSVNITFDEASATSDCPCPGIKLWQSSGPANSSDFPIGTTPVCFTAADSCNNTNTCCFNVSIQAAPEACDIKTIGCVKFELLGISLDGELNRRYTIRLTNNCNNKLIYTAFQIPDGLPALYPSDNSIFTAPSGRTYLVRNPNYTPSYSIRFKSVSDSISNGEYEVFNYQIPAQIAPDYIHAMVRLEPQIYYEVHLNTFYCPITHEGQIQRPVFNKSGEISLFPNPTDGLLWIDLSSLNSPMADLRIFDTRGNLVLQQQADVEKGLQSIALPEKLPNGVYFVQVQNDKGDNQTLRFVVQR